MDPYVAMKLVALVVLLILSAFFSSVETALTTVNQVRIKTLAEEGDLKAKRVCQVISDRPKMLSAILIGNNLVNISASSLATTLAIDFFGSMGAGIATGILTLLILVFGEITPKTYASYKAEKMSLRWAGVIAALMVILTPLIFIINALASVVLSIYGVKQDALTSAYTEEEIRTILHTSHETGNIESDSHEVMNNMMDFHDSEAKEIMVPRYDMKVIDINSSFQDTLSLYAENKQTRFPVFEDSSDNIVGILNVKDLLLIEDKDNFSIREIMYQPFFTYEKKNTAELFIQMREESIAIAMVLDEYGDLSGMLTLEDLLEEIVGEIHDEYDEVEEADITEVSDRQYEVLGSANLEDVAEELKLPISSEDYDSMGGYVFGLLDTLPSEGDEITDEHGILYKVLNMDKNRISRVLINIPEESAEDEDSDSAE